MPNEAATTPPDTPAADSRRMLRRASKAALATLDRASGYPIASLVAIATEPDGAPILLLSRLALHTRNIEADPRASLLINTGGRGDPLASARVTLVGQVRPAAGSTAQRRFLAVHPSAAGYAGFADFGFYALQVERAHYVGGFGRIAPLVATELLLDVSGAGSLAATETELVATVNRDLAGGVARLGAQLSGGHEGPWRLTGIDPEGCDLALGDERQRGEFAGYVTNADEAWRAVSALVEAG